MFVWWAILLVVSVSLTIIGGIVFVVLYAKRAHDTNSVDRAERADAMSRVESGAPGERDAASGGSGGGRLHRGRSRGLSYHRHNSNENASAGLSVTSRRSEGRFVNGKLLSSTNRPLTSVSACCSGKNGRIFSSSSDAGSGHIHDDCSMPSPTAATEASTLTPLTASRSETRDFTARDLQRRRSTGWNRSSTASSKVFAVDHGGDPLLECKPCASGPPSDVRQSTPLVCEDADAVDSGGAPAVGLNVSGDHRIQQTAVPHPQPVGQPLLGNPHDLAAGFLRSCSDHPPTANAYCVEIGDRPFFKSSTTDSAVGPTTQLTLSGRNAATRC